MPEPIRPAGTKLYGRENWVFVPTIASATLAPTVAEVTGASALDITNIAFASTGRPTQTTNRVTAERRIGDTVQYQYVGTSTMEGGDLTYAVGDQAVAASDPKKAYEKFPAGTTGFLVQRRGMDDATAFASGQFVNVYPIEFGPSFPATAGDGESAEAAMTASFAVTGPPGILKAVLA